MHVQNLMNSLCDIRIFLGLVPEESLCIYIYIYIYIYTLIHTHVLTRFKIRTVVPERLKITDALEHAASMIGSLEVISRKDNTEYAQSDSQRYVRNRTGERP
jgi:hypothetical protein